MKHRDHAGWTIIHPNGRVTAKEPSVTVLDVTRLAFLAKAGALLPASLDEGTTLRNIAAIMVPVLSDLAFVHVEAGDLCIRRVGAARTDQWASACAERRIPRARIPGPGPEIARTIPEDWFADIAESREEALLLRESGGFRSAIRFPLISESECLGVITLLSVRRTYEPEDLVLALEVGARASTALLNCRVHERAVRESMKVPQNSIAMLNHELRNFVSPIIGWARVLASDHRVARDPILAEGAQSLERNASHMARLLNDCLDLSSFAEGKMQLDRTLLDLGTVVRAAIDRIARPLHEKHHHLAIDISARPVWIQADVTRLSQVITNLLLNAIKYTAPRGYISIRLAQREQAAEISIADNGPGLAPSELNQIFDPFVQGEQRSYGGLGLGLAISRSIVQLHGGTLWAESAGEGRGSTFRVSLPLSEQVPAQEPSPSLPARAVHPRRILLVEDAPDVRTLMRLQMESMGHVVRSVARAGDAVRNAREVRPDLVISDIKMAGTDGYSLARQFQKDPSLGSIPLLAISGTSSRSGIQQIQEAGYATCLLKPVDDEELGHWIDRLTAGR